MKFRTLVAIAAAAAASAVAWKMVKDARREDDDITLELAGDGAPDAQEAQEAQEAREAEEAEESPEAEEVQEAQEAQEKEAAAETAAPQRPIDPTTIASAEDFAATGRISAARAERKAATGPAGPRQGETGEGLPAGRPRACLFCRLFPWGGGRAAGKQR